MAIDPGVLVRQRVAVQRFQRPHLHLVPSPRPKCLCGRCDTCKKRMWMRAYRATLPKPPRQRMGPKIDPERLCGKCTARISRANTSGRCADCAPRSRPSARGGYFMHGGGI